jgi:hypothetical protein
MNAVQPKLAALYARVRVLKGDVASAQRLHFGAFELDAGLERLEDLELVARLAIARDDLLA